MGKSMTITNLIIHHFSQRGEREKTRHKATTHLYVFLFVESPVSAIHHHFLPISSERTAKRD